METEIAFGKVLREKRRLSKLSQEKLSQESGLDRSYISLLERGLRQPTLKTILLLSDPLNIQASKMVEEVETILNENRKNRISNS